MQVNNVDLPSSSFRTEKLIHRAHTRIYFQKGSLHFCFPSIHQIAATWIYRLTPFLQPPPSSPALSSSAIFLLLFYLEHSNRILVSIYSQMCVAVKHIKLNGLRISNSLNDCCLICVYKMPSLAMCVSEYEENEKTVTAQKRCRNNNFYNYICRFIYILTDQQAVNFGLFMLTISCVCCTCTDCVSPSCVCFWACHGVLHWIVFACTHPNVTITFFFE